MIFKKPENVRYVDMAKYIDDYAYRDDKDESLIYEYVFHLSRMIARKRNLFLKTAELDDFALYMSSYVMCRYRNPKQFEFRDGKPRMTKIKHILNYIKKTVYVVSIRFREETYASKIHKAEEIDISNMHNFKDSLSDSCLRSIRTEIGTYVDDIPKTIESYIKKTPYTGLELKNIYISCVLTLMSWMTLPIKNEKRVNKWRKYAKSIDDLIESLYENERKTQVILYNLDNSMRDYIRVLCNRIRNIIIEDINYLMTSGCGETDIRDLLVDYIENI